MIKACSLFLAGLLSLAGPAALSPESRGQAGRGFPGRDSAAGWQQLGPNGGEIRTIVPNPQDKSEIWGVSGSNPALIFRSTDSGGTWKRIAVATEALNSLVAHPANGVHTRWAILPSINPRITESNGRPIPSGRKIADGEAGSPPTPSTRTCSMSPAIASRPITGGAWPS